MAYQRLDITDLKTILTAAQISHIEDGIIQNESDIADNTSIIGSTNISTIADGTLTGAVAELNTDLTEIAGDATDSGWITLTLTSDFAAYNSSQTPKYRKIGKMVQLTGAVAPTISGTGSTENIQFGTLPSGYRPDQNVITLCQGSGVCKWVCTISSGGAVSFGRYSDNSGYAAFSSSVWLPFHATFFVD